MAKAGQHCKYALLKESREALERDQDLRIARLKRAFMERLEVLEGGHFPHDLRGLVRHTLEWFDKYVGPVRQQD